MSDVKEINLNMGGWTETRPGYTNIDLRLEKFVDLVADVRDLSDYFKPGTVDNIMAFEILEHFGKDEILDVLKHWVGLLKPGGKLFIRVPDVVEAVNQYQEGKIGPWELNRILYATQDYDTNFHKIGFTPSFLRELLEGFGMKPEVCQHVYGTRMFYMDAVKEVRDEVAV